jgi:chaperone required for assembly of F1-ATPase
MSEWKAKRFWTSVSLTREEAGFGISLDGRPVKTPAKRVLAVPTENFARAIAAEWEAQQGLIDPRTMPFTRTANAAIDKVATQKDEVAQMLAAYGDADLLCYRATMPAGLVERQSALWDPILDWAEEALSVRLETREGVMHRPQDPEALAGLTKRVFAFNAFELAAFHDLVSLSGSLILGFASTENLHEAKAIWDISRLDENWQAEQWGRDDDAETAAAVKEAAFVHAKQVFDLVQPGVLPN